MAAAAGMSMKSEKTPARASSAGTLDARALSQRAGFACALACAEIYSLCLLAGSVEALNYTLYEGLFEVACFAVCAIIGAFRPPVARPFAAAVAGVVGGFGLLAVASNGFAGAVLVAAATGLGLGYLLVFWEVRLARSFLDEREVWSLVLWSVLASVALCALCSFSLAAAKLAGGGCAIASGLLALRAPRSPRLPRQPKGPAASAGGKKPRGRLLPKPLPSGAPFLVSVGGCCIAGGFFSGCILNPYGFHSSSVLAFMLAATLISLAVMAVLNRRLAPSAAFRLSFIGAFIVLACGFTLVATGAGGGIVASIGLTLAGRNLCVGVLFAALPLFARSARGGAMEPLVCLGLLLCNGTLSRCTGVFVGAHFGIDFTGIAMGSIVVLLIFACFYAFCSMAVMPVVPSEAAPRPQSQQAPQPQAAVSEEGARAGEAPVPEGDMLASLGLTSQETRVAKHILGGAKYEDIAASLGISVRPVKFHAKHAFEKAQVQNKTEFIAFVKTGKPRS